MERSLDCSGPGEALRASASAVKMLMADISAEKGAGGAAAAMTAAMTVVAAVMAAAVATEEVALEGRAEERGALVAKGSAAPVPGVADCCRSEESHRTAPLVGR